MNWNTSCEKLTNRCENTKAMQLQARRIILRNLHFTKTHIEIYSKRFKGVENMRQVNKYGQTNKS